MMHLSRRDLLAALVSAPVAAAACRRGARSLPPGELAASTEALGHRVRDGARVQVPAGAWEKVQVVVIGAGVAGLSAAWRLLRGGATDLVVLELDGAPGGTSRSGQGPVCAYPWGAHYVTAPMRENETFIELLREAGIVEGTDDAGDPVIGEAMLCREPQERVFFEGRWHEGPYLHHGATPEDLRELSALQAEIERLSGLRDGRGRRAFAIPVATGSDDADFAELDRVSMAEWMDRKGWRSPRLRWLADYACRDDYGARAEETSAWAALFYWAARTRSPGRPAQPVVTWPEGNGRLVAHLAARVGARVRTNLAAVDVAPDELGVSVTALSADGRAVGLRASRVVFAAPQYVARAAIRPWRDAPPLHLADFEYAPWAVCNLHLSGRPRDRGLRFAWDSVLYDSPSLGYVTATHQLCRDHGPTVLTWYRALTEGSASEARRRLLEAGRDAWADAALADLERAHPELRELVTRVDVARWGHAMIRPRPGFQFGAARRAAARPYRGVHFANTDLSGIALFEEAFHHGVRAAEEVLAAGRPSPPGAPL